MATAASPEKKSAAAFFQHPLPPVPESQPPYYVRLFEDHLAALVPNEAELVAADYFKVCHDLSSRAVAPGTGENASERSTPFQVNDGLQAVLDHPLHQFAGAGQSNTSGMLAAANDAWEKRRAAMRAYSQAFFQRAVTVVSANLQHADVLQAAGFKRRGDIGGGQSYVSEADGLYIHVWRTSSEARHLVDTYRGLQQALFEYGIRTIRAPIVSIFLFRGILYTVSPAIPAIADQPVPGLELATAAPKAVDAAVSVATDAAALRIALGETFAGEAHPDGALPSLGSLRLRRGIDGRVYVTSFDWRTDNMAFTTTDMPATVDSNVWLRREAIGRMDAATRTAIRQQFKKGGRGAQQAARKFIVDTLLPQCTEELLKEVNTAQGQLTILYRDNTVARVMHSWGVPMRLMFAIYERVWTSKNSTDKKNDPRLKMLKEALETEMVLRTAKQLVRLEIRASPGEDGTAHVHRVNRLYNSCTKKATGVWNDMFMPVLRRKYDAAPDFTVGLTAGLLKLMAAYGSSRLGAAYDKNASRFTAFTSIHQATTIFTQPSIVEKCSVANNPTAGNDAASPTSAASPTGQLQTAASSTNFEESTSMTLNTSASMRMPARSSSGNPNALVLDDARRTAEIAALKEAFAAGVKAATGSATNIEGLFTPLPPPCDLKQPPMALVSRAWPEPFVVVRMIRQAVMLRLLGAPDFDATRRSIVDALSNVIRQERDAAREKASADQLREDPDLNGHWSPAVLLWLRFVLMGDTLRMADAEVLEELTDAIADRLGNYVGDDASTLGRAKITASKVNGFVPGVVVGAKMLRRATWVDVGLNNDYFRELANCAVTLNVNSSTAVLAEVFRLLSRVSRRQDVTNRRATLIACYRKMGAALVSSQTPSACEGLREAAADGIKHHYEKFGPADVQTSVMVAHAVYVHVNAHADKLNDKQTTELRKFHYQVASMGSCTVEQLKTVLKGEQYLTVLASMITILNDFGDTLVAEKALNQTAGASGGDLDSKGAKVAATVATMQTGAAGRLQRMVRLAANIGPEHLIRRLHRETGAYRQGLAIIELEERFHLERVELMERYLCPLRRMHAFEAKQRQRVYFFGGQHIYEVPPDLPDDVAAAIDAEETAGRDPIVAEEKKERGGITMKKAMFNQLVRRQLGGRAEVASEEEAARDAVDFKAGMARARLKIEFQESRTRVYGDERQQFVFGEITTRLALEARLASELHRLRSDAAESGDRTQRHVAAREELESAEAAIRAEDIERVRDDEIARLAVELEEALHRAAINGGLDADGALLLDGVQAEHLKRHAIESDESAAFTAIREDHVAKSSALDAAMADKKRLSDDEHAARLDALVGPEHFERAFAMVDFEETAERMTATFDGVTGGDSLLLQSKTIGDQLGTQWEEELARRVIAGEESEQFGSYLADLDQGAATKREQRLERERFEEDETAARAELASQITSEHQSWLEEMYAEFVALDNANTKARASMEHEESTTRERLEDDLLTDMLTWMRTTHAEAVKAIDGMTGARLELEAEEERARHDRCDEWLHEHAQWLQDLKNRLERERDAMAGQRLDLEEDELGARKALERTLLAMLVENARVAYTDALVAPVEAAERAALRKQLKDPKTLAALRAREADRIEHEQRQHAERAAFGERETAARRSLMRDWLESTKAGVTLWMQFLEGARRFDGDESHGRSAVVKQEADKWSRIVSTYRAEHRHLAMREEARRKAAERGAIGPIRQLHRAIKAERVRELRQEEEVVSALAEVVREAESAKQQQIHDRVAASKSKVRSDKERRRAEAIEEKRRQREFTSSLTEQARAEEAERLAAARKQHAAEREEHKQALQRNGKRRVEHVKAARKETEEGTMHLQESAAERQARVLRDKQEREQHHETLIAGRQPFSVAQSRKDALAEKAALLERMRKEREILAAIRYLDAKDEEAIAEERRRHTRAAELVAFVARDAVAEKRTLDVQAEVAEAKRERAQRASGEESVLAEKRVEFRSRRQAHLERMLQTREEKLAMVEAKIEAIQRSKDLALQDAARQDEHDAAVAAARRDDATLLEQQRVECKLAELRHHREEEGHVVKSPVKSPLPIRHLPPIRHDHTRILQQQAALLQRRLEAGDAAHDPPAALSAGSPANHARASRNNSRPASSGGTGTAAAMNDE
eukprot:CAMPEP_0174878266 /NCGR_PEP_ID=MMETSP1114-20130205/82670_1 /TAXON_ID=312471 /ORGANISM="Neobodo designis, Strain CCAP 1951/1" /LENGTH=2159 /DNA_ID=CAMNT_0016113653 /DNA_START=138 /DNA_END=6617 /DNA_ORIENTATION=-